MGEHLFGAQAVPGKDVAYTPDVVAAACIHMMMIGTPDPIGVAWDPYGGGGAYGRALAPWVGHHLLATDIDPHATGLHERPLMTDHKRHTTAVWDAGEGLPPGWPRPDWIASNPPFSALDKHLPVLLETAKVGVAMLIIGQWLAPGARDWLWDTARPDEVIWIRERIPFSGPGRDGTKTDQREYAWPIWRRQPDGGWMGRGLIGRVSWHTGKHWRAA